MNEKLNGYFELLYPNLEELSDEEQYFAAGDKHFMFQNIDAIDRKFQEMVYAKERRGEEIDEQKIMKIVFDGIRTDRYFELLHPNLEELNDEEQYFAAGDKHFMFQNIDAIDRKFQEMVDAKERRGEEIDEHEIIQKTISELKTKKITPQQIGKATTNVPTKAKKVAKQVEITENTKDKGKEGEEVGDGN